MKKIYKFSAALLAGTLLAGAANAAEKTDIRISIGAGGVEIITTEHSGLKAHRHDAAGKHGAGNLEIRHAKDLEKHFSKDKGKGKHLSGDLARREAAGTLELELKKDGKMF